MIAVHQFSLNKQEITIPECTFSPSFSRSTGKDTTAACLTLVLLFRVQKEVSFFLGGEGLGHVSGRQMSAAHSILSRSAVFL